MKKSLSRAFSSAGLGFLIGLLGLWANSPVIGVGGAVIALTAMIIGTIIAVKDTAK